MEQPGSHWKEFYNNLNLRIFRKSVDEVEVPLKFVKNKEHFT
jgi:hypothetical protein